MADLTTLLSKFLGAISAGLPTFGAGGGTGTASVSGTLTTGATSVGTAADTNETDLWTYTLPANTLSANGRGVRITVWFTTAANANTKTGKLYFGSTVLGGPSTTVSAAPIRITAEVIRTGAGTQVYSEVGISGNFASGTSQNAGALTETLTGAVTIKATGTNGTAAANDIVFKGAIVEVIGNP
jgi:hypothetical protein